MRRTGVLRLFFVMMKIGLFTFGGGLSMLSLLRAQFVEREGLMTEEEFLDMVAISESTPGPIAINAATYIGYRRHGFWGSLAATVGVCLPSFVILYLISLVFDAFLSLTLVAAAFRGIQVGVVYLLLDTGLSMLRHMKKTPLSLTVFLAVLVTMLTLSVLSVTFSAVWYILLSAALSLILYAVGCLHRRRKGGERT